jgi:hypothetical protein
METFIGKIPMGRPSVVGRKILE